LARPEKPIISRDRAARAALSVIDTHGLEAFGLQLVAERLGVKTPSLYYHFQDKAELLAEVTKLLFIEGKLPPLQAGQDWREAIVQISLASWRSILRHPHCAPLLLQFFPRHLLLGAYEYWIKLFELNDVPPELHLMILEGSEKLTYGSALFAAAGRARAQPPFPEYDPKQHPSLAAAISATRWDDERTFAEALRAFLRGLPIGEHAENQLEISALSKTPGD